MPKRLAEIVIDGALASREDVVRAAQLTDSEEEPLVVALVRHIGVDELALVAAIKRQVRVSIADPALVEHDPEAIRELSRDTCWRLRVMPLRLSVYDTGPRVLHVVMADPTDTVAAAEVEHVTGCQVDAALMPLSAVEELIEKAYRSFVTEVIPRDRAPYGGELEVSTQPMARLEEAPSEPGAGAGGDRPAKPSTVPFHRVADEAGVDVRLRALVELLCKKELITASEYEEQVRALMKRHEDEG